MKTKFCVALLTAMALAATLRSPAETPEAPKVKVTELMRRIDPHDEKMEIVMVRLDLVPGASSAPHMHHGFIAGYVESGRFDFQLEGEPLLKLKAGDTFYEAP